MAARKKRKGESIRPTIAELQQDVSDLLGSAKASVEAGWVTLGKSDSEMRGVLARLEAERSKVSSLELRVTVVAPMNAGKSTLINAIIGDEVLPHRVTGMTTLPTEIVEGGDTPTLLIPRAMSEALRLTARKVKDLRSKRPDFVEMKLSNSPQGDELRRLAADPAELRDLPAVQKVSGAAQIRSHLEWLNDFLRLAVLLEAPLVLDEDFGGAPPVPRVETPFASASSAVGGVAGRLVLVDTPGPNEAHVAPVLERVVQDELNRATIVMLVLDFTQLNNQAEAALNQQLRPTLSHVGREQLLVVVNKVDQRSLRGRDLDSAGVVAYVRSALGAPHLTENETVFETAACRLLPGRRVLAALAEYGEDAPGSGHAEALRALAALVNPLDDPHEWEEEIRTSTLGSWEAGAEKAIRKAGVDPLLHRLVVAAGNQLAPKVLDVALNVSETLMAEMKDHLELLVRTRVSDAQKVSDELARLEERIAALAALSSRVDARLSEKLAAFEREAEEMLQSTRNEARVQAQTALRDAASEFTGSGKDVKRLISRILQSLGELRRTRFRGALALDTTAAEQGDSALQFDTREEAERAGTRIAEAVAKDILGDISDTVALLLDAVADEMKHGFSDLIAEASAAAVEAQGRLRREFDAKLELPPPQSPSIELGVSIVPSEGKKEVSRAKKGFHLKTVRLFSIIEIPLPWYGDHFVPVEATVYEVRASDVSEAVVGWLGDSVNASKAKLVEYVEGEMREAVDGYVGSVKEFIGDYASVLSATRIDQTKTAEEQARIIHEMEALRVSVASSLDRAAALRRAVAEVTA